MLLDTNRQNPSGIDYTGPDADRVRVLIDVAIADLDGGRTDVVLHRLDALGDQQPADLD